VHLKKLAEQHYYLKQAGKGRGARYMIK
jgi:hypothetical protein